MISKHQQLFLFLAIIIAQIGITEPKCLAQKREFIVGDYYSHSISYRNITSTNSVWNFLTNNLDSIEQPNGNTNFGFNCEIKLSKRFNVGVGLGINTISEKSHYIFITSIKPILYQTETYYNTYNYLKFPLFVDYKLIDINDFSIGINAGLSSDFLIDHKINRLSMRNDNSLSEWKYCKIALSAFTGFDFEYRINQFIPYFNCFYYHYITSNVEYEFEDTTGIFKTANVTIKQHNYYYGFEFGLKYIIKPKDKNTN